MTRRQVSPLRPRRLLAAAAVAVVAATSPLTTAQARQPAATHLELAEQTPAVAPGGDFVVRVRVAGAPTGSKVQVEVHARVRFRSAFQRSLDGEELGSRIGQATPVDATPTTTVTVPTQPLRLEDGVYPVTIDLIDDEGSRIDRLLTYLVRLPANPGDDLPLDVGVVLPVNAPPSLRPDLSTVVTNAARDAARVARTAANQPRVPLTIAVSPELLDALATSSNADDQTLLAGLRDAAKDDEVVGVPYANIEAAAWWNTGLLNPLANELDRGIATLSQRLAPPTTTTWIADREMNPGLARWLHDRGVRRMVVPEESLSPLGEAFNFTLTQPFELDLDRTDGMQVLAADAGLAAHVGSTGDPVLDAYRLVADLAILYYDQPGAARRGAVVTLPSNRSVDPEFFVPLHDALALPTGPIFKASTVDALFDTVPRADDSRRRDGTGEPLRRGLVPAPAGDLEGFPDALRNATDQVASYHALVGPNSTRADALDRARLVAGARTHDEDERAEFLTAVEEFVTGELAKITAPERQTIRFTARDGTVAFAVQNHTGYPVEVRLQLRGSKLEFPQHPDRALDLTLREETTRVELQVRTRSSGDSPLDVTITTPDDRLVLGTTRVTVRSTAFSGLGVVLSVGAGVFLVGWWGRHILRDRRRRPRPRHAVGSHDGGSQ